MAPSIFSSSLAFKRLISTFKSLNSHRMMSTNPSPCLMLPPTFDGDSDNIVYNMYNLAQNKVLKFKNPKLIPEEDTRIVGSSHGWLALFNERNCDLILANPVTRRHIKLPPSQSDEPKEFPPPMSCVSKVIISCDAEQNECQAMMIYDSWRLAFCHPGRSPTEWTPIGALNSPSPSNYRRCYNDLVYSGRHNLFFCVTEYSNGDDLEAWDVVSEPPRLIWEDRELLFKNYTEWLSEAKELLQVKTGLRCETFRYLVLVEQTDQLLFVTRHLVRQMAPDGSSVEGLDNDNYPYKTVSFNVHKIDWELGGGVRLSHLDGGSLDGLAMFVGLNHSFAVTATEANGLKPNSIYFADEKEVCPPKWCGSNYGGHDIGIFDYESKTISPCYYPCNLQSFKRIMPSPVWFTPTHN